jgi:hypothetical protein
MHQSCSPLQSSHFPLETSGAPLPYINQPQQGNPLGCGLTNGMDNQGSMHPLDPAFCRPMGSHHPFLNGVSDAASQVKMHTNVSISQNVRMNRCWIWGMNALQVGAFWQDDLQSVVQMDMGQSQEIATSSNSYNGSLQTVHMKMELWHDQIKVRSKALTPIVHTEKSACRGSTLRFNPNNVGP